MGQNDIAQSFLAPDESDIPGDENRLTAIDWNQLSNHKGT